MSSGVDAPGGTRREMDCPIISSAVYPNRRVAPEFQLVTTPSSVLPTIASSDESTIAARRTFAASARLRSVTSRMELETKTPSSVSIGLRLISTGNSVPSLRRPKRSRVEPMDLNCGFAK